MEDLFYVESRDSGSLGCPACRLSLMKEGRKSTMDDEYTLAPVTIGEYLRTEWLQPLGLSAYRVAKDIGITAGALLNILNGKRNMSLDTAWRLAHYFGMSRNYFINLQNALESDAKEEEYQKTIATLPVYDRMSMVCEE
jgi:addiction module HigA family antidote